MTGIINKSIKYKLTVEMDSIVINIFIQINIVHTHCEDGLIVINSN